MKNYLALILTLILSENLSAQTNSTHLKPRKNLLKKSFVPLSLITSGILLSDSGFEKSLNTGTRNWVGHDFRTSLDDYTWYAPLAMIYIAGIRARIHWFDQTKNLAKSMFLRDILTKGIKEGVFKIRPDGSNENAFPSGQTSISFAASSVVYEEFKNSSSLVAYGGYGFAAVAGSMCMANNKHWFSDVLVGMGMGILMTELVYHFDYLFKWNPFLKAKDIFLIQRYANGNARLYFSKRF